jgi:hypothetical protein
MELNFEKGKLYPLGIDSKRKTACCSDKDSVRKKLIFG